MAYTINQTTIDGDKLIANVTLHLAERYDLIVNVPVTYPKSETEVIAAIEQREKNEVVKFETEPTLLAVKADLDKRIGVKTIAKVG
jgi:hypothetical protein